MTAVLLLLLLVLCLAGWLALAFMSEPGPNAVGVLLRRYGVGPFAVALVAGAVLVGSLVSQVVVILAVGVVVIVALAMGWGPATWHRAARRCALRARWTSVARSSDIAVQRDHRVPGFGADSGTLTEIVRLEWTPTISHGRALPHGGGVVYRLRPARGSSIPEIAERQERLAAGLGVAEVIVERDTPSQGRLVVLWRPL